MTTDDNSPRDTAIEVLEHLATSSASEDIKLRAAQTILNHIEDN